MHAFYFCRRFAAIILVLALPALVQAQQADEAEEEQDTNVEALAEEAEDALELGTQVVTGSRLIGGDPSARIYSFTAEQIAARGVSTLEDFFRKLPWTYSSMTSQTSSASNNNQVFLPGEDSIRFRGNGLAISSLNLRGLGSPNTLILLNGRRIAGVGGVQDDLANILNVPLSAIERVDVQLDGASTVYGSDAIGGVVNFITRKNYRGLSASYRHEYSSTDADQTRASITGGYAWGSGNVTAIVSRSTSKPITNEKTGWTTLDYRGLYGPEFDRRITDKTQPGVACRFRNARRVGKPFYLCVNSGPPLWQNTLYQLPADHSGAGATEADFHTFTNKAGDTAPTPLDELPPQNGMDSSTRSLSLNVEQYVTDSLRVFADVNWSVNEAYQEYDRRINGKFLVPASNAYNPFGEPMLVHYAAVNEFGDGLLPQQYDFAENETRNLSFGLIWTFGADHELMVDATRTKSWRTDYGLRAYAERSVWDPTAEAFYEALSSPDPDRALNVFGNGTVQGSFESVLTQYETPYQGTTDTRQYNVSLRGRLFRLWGGAITYSIGGEYRENIIFYSSGSYLSTFVPPESEWATDSALNVGLKRPSRDTQAYYGELGLPLVGPDNARTGLRSLILTLGARYDAQESLGAFGGDWNQVFVPCRNAYWDPHVADFVWFDDRCRHRNVTAILGTARSGRTTPRAGFEYKPLEELTMRVRWSRSFRAPNWTDQFYAQNPDRRPTAYASNFFQTIIDPYDPDGPTEITWGHGVLRQSLPLSPDIQSEHSDHWTVGIEWAPEAVPGLRWTADWSMTDFTNRIRSSGLWLSQNPEYVLNHPLVAERNERGDLVKVYSRRINIAAEYNDLLSTELEYSIDTRYGNFSPGIAYTRFFKDSRQVSPDALIESDLGTQNGPDRYKWQGSLHWLWGRVTASVFMYYTPGHVYENAFTCPFDITTIPDTRCTVRHEELDLDVSSLTTVDLTVTYLFDNGLRLRAGGTNILDRAAPRSLSFSAARLTQPYDPRRWDARGQVLFLELHWEM
ncbi:MAG: TonB-dependent receptor [Gammaproteobacteria bacterium]|nr:TonB-dependent receptor [Gammaproteobacteria bacterium]